MIEIIFFKYCWIENIFSILNVLNLLWVKYVIKIIVQNVEKLKSIEYFMEAQLVTWFDQKPHGCHYE